MDTVSRTLSLKITWLEREAEQSVPSDAEVKNA
jgi:hypothetical protein